MTAKLIRGRGIRRVLVRSLPLVVLDVAATVVAFLIAAWGTKAGEIDLASPFFMGQMALLSLVNVAVFGVFRMYNSLWEYASVDDAARIVLATAVGSVIGDVLGALVFDARHAVSRVHLRLGDFAGDLRHGAFCHTCEF